MFRHQFEYSQFRNNSFIFYAICFFALAIGTNYDLQIDMRLYNPQSLLAKLSEYFSQFPHFAIWGPAGTVLLFTRHSINEFLEIAQRIFPSVKTIENTSSKKYIIMNNLLNTLQIIGFLALTIVGWRKLIANTGKYIAIFITGKEWSNEVVWYAAAIIITLCSCAAAKSASKRTLNKLESLAVCAILFGLSFEIINIIKQDVVRVRFREMVAYSNGFVANGLSNSSAGELTKAMANNTDFSAFTNWFQQGNNLSIYSHSDSFPSGHAASGVFVFLTVMICQTFEEYKPFENVFFIFSALYAFSVAYYRMVIGAHYLSDVAMGMIISYTMFLFARQIMIWLTKKEVLPISII